jgi:hypothetical protein
MSATSGVREWGEWLEAMTAMAAEFGKEEQ